MHQSKQKDPGHGKKGKDSDNTADPTTLREAQEEIERLKASLESKTAEIEQIKKDSGSCASSVLFQRQQSHAQNIAKHVGLEPRDLFRWLNEPDIPKSEVEKWFAETESILGALKVCFHVARI